MFSTKPCVSSVFLIKHVLCFPLHAVNMHDDSISHPAGWLLVFSVFSVFFLSTNLKCARLECLCWTFTSSDPAAASLFGNSADSVRALIPITRSRGKNLRPSWKRWQLWWLWLCFSFWGALLFPDCGGVGGHFSSIICFLGDIITIATKPFKVLI